MGKTKPIILHKGGSEEGWDNAFRGHVQWRTLFSSERTPSEALTAGVAEILPGNELKAHHHAEPELYYIIEGEGVLTIDGLEHPVQEETAVFIPGGQSIVLKITADSPYAFCMCLPSIHLMRSNMYSLDDLHPENVLGVALLQPPKI